LYAAHFAAWRLVNVEGRDGLALNCARRAQALLRPSDPVALQASVLKTLAAALRKAGKGDEDQALGDRIARLDQILDQESLRKAPPLKAAPFAGRLRRGDRTVIFELFTGARCGPCVMADAAFDALLQTYRPRDVILIQHHLHIPGFDALTNEATEARAQYYRAFYTPSVFVDGKDMQVIKLPVRTAQAGYEAGRKFIEECLDAASEAELDLKVERNGDLITIRAEASRLKKTGDTVRLRLMLVEDLVRYEGNNGVRLNHHVARAFPGGTAGFPLKTASSIREITVNLGEIIAGLNRYLDKRAEDREYPDNDRPLALGPLKIVGVIQDDATKEVLQAVQVDIPAARRPGP
jgi:hypothetical protein